MAETQVGSAIPVARPQLPKAERLLPYLQRIDEARWYSNHGPLLREFEASLAKHFNVAPEHLAVVANGTVALSAALVALGAAPGSRCLLPSWTFVGSAAAAWAANLTPHFVDVDERSWMLSPQALSARRDLDDVSAVMTVSAFGAPVDSKSWDSFTEGTGIPALIDGAASLDTVASIDRFRPSKTPIMISLHATKVFGIGEGGLVVSTDTAFMERFRKVCNFGVWETPTGQILGYNAKLNEYNAAVGLAMLEEWPSRRESAKTLTAHYRSVLSSLPDVEMVPEYGEDWVSCYCNVRLRQEAAPVIARLKAQGIETRRWWQSGVHVQPAYRSFPHDDLSVTEDISKRTFGLPFFHDMAESQVRRVVEELAAAAATS